MHRTTALREKAPGIKLSAVTVILTCTALLIGGTGLPVQGQDPVILQQNLGNPFGVKAHLSWLASGGLPFYNTRESRILALSYLQDLDVGWVTYSIGWNEVQPDPGPFDFARHDALVDLVHEHNLHSLVNLGWSPSWASSAPPGSDARTIMIHPPANPADFYSYVYETVSRYRDRIRHWEIWNEPNNSHFLITPGSELPLPRVYLDMLRVAHQAVKDADPTAKVILGGLALNGMRQNLGVVHITKNWLRRFYIAGGQDYFDIMNIHPYPAPDPIGDHMVQTEETRAVMVGFGDSSKKIWISEMNSDFFPGPNENATQLRRVYIDLKKKHYVGKIFWFNLRNTVPDVNPELRYLDTGLLTYEMIPKPCFHEFADLIEDSWSR